MENSKLSTLLDAQLGKAKKGTRRYVFAVPLADNLFEKMKSSLIKEHFMLVCEENKLHILTLKDDPNDEVEITKQISYTIEALTHIVIGNVGSSTDPKAKTIAFKSPNGKSYKFHVSLTGPRTEQIEHVNNIIDRLLPTE